ncbi:MAG TPA: MaoC/PaaZ C-terminal domain-containing protein [Myxococcota bacterium]|nr:MaoC/PaaZ C-terminal domain-containing protein [Myxococcota bacterium]
MAMYLHRVGAQSEPARRTWQPRDCALYALAVGAGFEAPEFVRESPAQRVYPAFVLSGVMAAEAESWPDPGFATGDYAPHEIVQGEQALVVHAPIGPRGDVASRTRVAGIYDKGSGALVVLEVSAADRATGAAVFTATTSLFVKGHGGFGGQRGPRADSPAPPARTPDLSATWATPATQTLLWRHAGNDPNAIHVDPEIAARAGFRAPILSGLNTLGFGCRALVHAAAGGEPAQLRSLAGRFASPGYNGDALTAEIWTGDDLGRDARGDRYVLFRVVDQDGAVLIDRGMATLSG